MRPDQALEFIEDLPELHARGMLLHIRRFFLIVDKCPLWSKFLRLPLSNLKARFFLPSRRLPTALSFSASSVFLELGVRRYKPMLRIALP